jgi:transcription-repair coupling factor (superfamily II helicase)
MNLELLLKEYAKDPRCFQIADRITLSKMQQIHLSGLRGSATEFVLSSVFNHSATSQLNHLIILRDAEEAAYFHNTFENLRIATREEQEQNSKGIIGILRIN